MFAGYMAWPPCCTKNLGDCPWLAAETKRWLHNQFQFNHNRIAKMQVELQTILALFGRHHVPVLPLKGSLLTTMYADTTGPRPMADLDLLIQPQDFERSVSLLKQLGYDQDVVHWKHTEFIKPDNRAVVSTDVEHPDNPRGLELHLLCRETFGGPTIELTEMMWGNARPGTLLGEPATLPQLEVLWLHLLVHTTYHMWQGKGRLIQLVDLAQLSPQLNDPMPFLNAVDARFTYPGLALLHRYFPARLDQPLLRSQANRLTPAFRDWVAGLNLVNSSYLNPEPTGLYLSKALKFSEGRPLEVAQALRFALLPTLNEIALDHPRLATSKAPWLAYFLLPLDWLKRLSRKK